MMCPFVFPVLSMEQNSNVKLEFIGEFEKISLPVLRVVEDVDPYNDCGNFISK